MRLQRSYSTIPSTTPARGEITTSALLERTGVRARRGPERHFPRQLQYLAGGGQAGIFTLPGADWVIKSPRLSLLALLALYLRLPLSEARAHVEKCVGGLVLPYATLYRTEFSSVKLRGLWDTARPVAGSRKVYRPRRAMLTYRLESAAILEEQLERGTPAEVAEGLDALLRLLERLADRGFYLLDFVMKNFAWQDGELVIADVDLILPGAWTRHPHFWPVAHFFRRGLLRDYARIIQNALDRTGPDDDTAREQLQRLRWEFPLRVKALTKRATRPPTEVAEARPVTFPIEISSEVSSLLRRPNR